GQQAGAAIERHAEQKRAELRQQIKATQDPEKIEALQAQINEINTQERLLNVAVGALGGSGGVAALQAGLSEAADRMRRYTIADSEKFAGITDEETMLDNKSGESAGIRGDGFKTAGTRVVLDKLCGEVNERCRTQLDANGKSVLDANGIPKLELDGNGFVRFDRSKARMTMAQFLESDLGKEMSGPTGGNQGGPGTVFGFPYSPGGLLDLAHEAYGGSHDFIGGTLSGFYDQEGNARRGLTSFQKGMYDTWTGIALLPATPFALSEALPPQAWKALDMLLRMKR
ncbi:hypothetical protein, partial [Achromobacter xylosoxidans]|uniref:hypothetical protein n=1 Tax=Alcaligenes xylosoxydans xylosoxydans TaxID=85698 RepID=UPI001F14082B